MSGCSRRALEAQPLRLREHPVVHHLNQAMRANIVSAATPTNRQRRQVINRRVHRRMMDAALSDGLHQRSSKRASRSSRRTRRSLDHVPELFPHVSEAFGHDGHGAPNNEFYQIYKMNVSRSRPTCRSSGSTRTTILQEHDRQVRDTKRSAASERGQPCWSARSRSRSRSYCRVPPQGARAACVLNALP